MSSRFTLLLTASLLGSNLSGCVARDAGYSEVQRGTSERIGKEVHWRRHDDAQARTREVTRSLLSRPLTVESAVQLGLLNSSAVQVAFEELGLARAELARALAIPNPSAELAVRFNGGSRPDLEIHAYEDVLGLLFLPLRSGAARAALDAAKRESLGRVLDHALAVRLAFYEYQASAQTLVLRRTILQAVRASYDAAQRMHEAGNVSELNLASERALYEEARIEFARAEAAERALREQLNERMGLFAEGESWGVEPRLPDASPVAGLGAELEQRALSQSIDLEVLRARYASAAKQANYAQLRGVLPSLRAGVSAERSEAGSFAIGPAAALGVPLFYQGQAEVDAAESDMQRQRQSYDGAALRIRSSARALSVGLQSSAASADYYKRVLLPLRDEIVRNTELEYNAMSVGVFQLLQAKREQIRAAVTYVDLLKDYWSLRARAEQLALGRLPPTGSFGSSVSVAAEASGSAEAH
ncbi:MAG: TolC family protein [Polyangiaceae bacterium]